MVDLIKSNENTILNKNTYEINKNNVFSIVKFK